MIFRSIARNTMIMLFTASCLAISAQESPASLYNSGLEKAKAKEYAEALDLMDQAIAAADPEDEKDQKVIDLAKRNASRAAYALGYQHRKAEKYEDALAMHDKGIEYNPDYYSNYRGKAQVLEAQGNNVDAVKWYIKAGQVAEGAGEQDKADSYYAKATNFVAKAAIDDKWDETIALANAFMESGRKDADVYYYYGRAQMAQGDYAGALESAGMSLEMGESDESSKYYMLKGEAHAAMGQKQEAIDAYSKVTDPKYAERAKYEIDQLEG